MGMLSKITPLTFCHRRCRVTLFDIYAYHMMPRARSRAVSALGRGRLPVTGPSPSLSLSRRVRGQPEAVVRAAVDDGRLVPRRRRLRSSSLSLLSLCTLDRSSREDLRAFLSVCSFEGRPLLRQWMMDTANPPRSLILSHAPFLTRHRTSLTSLSTIIATKYAVLRRGPSRGSPRASGSVTPRLSSSPGTTLRRLRRRGCPPSPIRNTLITSSGSRRGG